MSQNKVGIISKDASRGPFVDEWKEVLAEECKDREEVDITAALSTAAFSTKDEAELRAVRNSSKACVALMHSYFLDEMSTILDQEKKVKHRVLADKVDGKLDDEKFWKSVKLPTSGKLASDFDPTQLDWTIGPVVYSGGKFDLKMQVESSEENLHPGVIVAGMGLRYRSYCSSIARTYMVDPNKTQESNYKFLLTVHNLILKEIRDGAVAKDVYNKALSYVKSKKPELEKHFVKNVGFGIGLENKDPTLVLNGKNARALKDGMTLCVSTGFQDLENPQPQDKNSKIYSLIVTDTIRVTGEGTVNFTGEAAADPDSTSFFFKDDEEQQPAPKKEKKDSRVGAVAAKNITSSRLRSGRGHDKDDEAENRRKEHQKELAAKKHKEGLARFAESTTDPNGGEAKKFKRFESYKRDNQFPSKVRDMGIVVDQKNSTVILPVMGRPVPFHIQTIKNASKSDEGEWSFLRINFLSPGQGVGRKDDQPFEDASAHFVRSLTFRSTDGDRYTEIANQISNMKRDLTKKEQEKKDMEDVVEQDKLVEIRSRSTCAVQVDSCVLTCLQTVARPSWTTSSCGRPWRESVSLAKSRYTRTVSDTSLRSTHIRESTSSSPTSAIFSSSPASMSLLLLSISISRTRSLLATRRRRGMSSSTGRPLTFNSTRRAIESASTGMVTKTSLRQNRRSVADVRSSTVCSRASPRRLPKLAAMRVSKSICP